MREWVEKPSKISMKQTRLLRCRVDGFAMAAIMLRAMSVQRSACDDRPREIRRKSAV